MLGFLFGLGIGSMLLHSGSSNSGNKNQVEAFRFEQLSTKYYESVKEYVKDNRYKNKEIWWTKVKGYTFFIFLHKNTFEMFYPKSNGWGSYYLRKVNEIEYKIEDDKIIFTYDDELIESKTNYIKGSKNKLILHNIDDDNDNNDILVKRIVIES